MPDEITPEEIRMTQQTVLLVEAWPRYILLSDEFLTRQAHVQRATVDGDTVTFDCDNGTGKYVVRRDLPKQGKRYVAELVEGDSPSMLKRRAQKYVRETV